MDITGRQRSIKPNTSFISYLKNSQEKYSTYPLPNQYGDFNFENLFFGKWEKKVWLENTYGFRFTSALLAVTKSEGFKRVLFLE